MEAIVKEVSKASECVFLNGSNCNIVEQNGCKSPCYGADGFPSFCPLLDQNIAVSRRRPKKVNTFQIQEIADQS